MNPTDSQRPNVFGSLTTPDIDELSDDDEGDVGPMATSADSALIADSDDDGIEIEERGGPHANYTRGAKGKVYVPVGVPE